MIYFANTKHVTTLPISCSSSFQLVQFVGWIFLLPSWYLNICHLCIVLKLGPRDERNIPEGWIFYAQVFWKPNHLNSHHNFQSLLEISMMYFLSELLARKNKRLSIYHPAVAVWESRIDRTRGKVDGHILSQQGFYWL